MSEQANEGQPTPEQIRERLKKATPGPWAWEATGEKDNTWSVGVVVDDDDQPMLGQVSGDEGTVDETVAEGDGNLADPDFIAHAPTDIAFLLSLLDQRDAEIATAREACPVVRQQRFFDATLLEAVNEQVLQLIRMESRAQHAEASLLRMTEERDQLKAENEEWSGSFDLYIKASHALMAAWKQEHPEANHWPGVAAVNEWALTKVARLTEAHERLKGLSAKWRERQADIMESGYECSAAGTNEPMIAAELSGRLRGVQQCADDLDALLAPPEEKKDER